MERKIFRDPPRGRRAKPFWSLNGELEEEELKRQIAVMEKMGFGGAYLHARTGLKTEYLSDEWFRLMNVCADELAARGMEAWLYDEDRYPSGVAGGLVTKDPAFRGKYLTVRFEEDTYTPREGDLAAFFVLFDIYGRMVLYRPYKRQKGTIVVFSVHLRENQDVYNGYSYVDTLKREATEEFLRVTHEQYAEKMGERLGDSVKGIFTDEPNRGAIFNGFAHEGEHVEWRIPYTEELFETYHTRWHERLEERLPELYFRGLKVFSRTVWRYTETLTALFLDNFCKPYAQWCKEHGIAFTGHILHEDNLAAMTTLCGSPMRFYEHMDIPGVDNLTAENTNPAVPLMAYSVARQCKKRGVMCEMYAAIGWQTDFATYKRIGDWNALFGVNERCTHLSMYTMAGGAKRDYPASILHQSDWWKDYSLVEDYFARLNYFLGQGKRQAELLYIHPVESAWGMSRLGGYRDYFTPIDEEYLAIERRYAGVVNALAAGGVPFDFADEEMLSRLHRLATMKKRPVVCVGAERYPAVLLAGNVTLRASTYRILEYFLGMGGKVYLVGDYPSYRDGNLFRSECVLKGVIRVTEEELAAQFSLPYRAEGGTAYVRCSNEGKTLYFTAVSTEQERKEFKFTFEGRYLATRFFPRTGDIQPFDVSYEGGKTVAEISLDAGEELLLELCTRRRRRAAAQPPVVCTPVKVPGEFEYRLGAPNVCVLDFAQYEARDHCEGEDEILRVDRTLRQEFGLPQRTPEAIQPWFRKKFLTPSPVSEPVVLKTSFFVKNVPEDLRLVREPIEGEHIFFNGKELDLTCATPSEKDRCFAVLRIPRELVIVGKNFIERRFELREETDIEAMYLTGNFGVEAKGRYVIINRLPAKLKAGDVTKQGLPFYGGEIIYKVPLARGKYRVSLPAFGGALARVGKERLAFKPFTATVRSRGTVEISVTASRKNTFGPLHYLGHAYSSPGEFYPPDELFSEDYLFLPQGLLESPVIEKIEEKS